MVWKHLINSKTHTPRGSSSSFSSPSSSSSLLTSFFPLKLQTKSLQLHFFAFLLFSSFPKLQEGKILSLSPLKAADDAREISFFSLFSPLKLQMMRVSVKLSYCLLFHWRHRRNEISAPISLFSCYLFSFDFAHQSSRLSFLSCLTPPLHKEGFLKSWPFPELLGFTTSFSVLILPCIFLQTN